MIQNQWNSTYFFTQLTNKNRLAQSLGFVPVRCSGLQGFQDAVSIASTAPNIVAIDDSSEGFLTLQNPRTQTVKTVYLAMRTKAGDTAAREYALEQMREIFRQFMTILIRERIRVAEHGITLDTAIQFNEIDRYFCTGATCACFNISVSIPTDLCFNPDHWL